MVGLDNTDSEALEQKKPKLKHKLIKLFSVTI